MEWHVVNVVWGERHTKLWLDVAVPALLADGNLPALAHGGHVTYRLYTRAQELAVIRSHPTYRLLQSCFEVHEFVNDRLDYSGDKYKVMNLCHCHALLEAAREDAALVFSCPDAVWSDGSLAYAARSIEKGHRAVMTAGVRVDMRCALESLLPETEGGVLRASPEQLAGLASRSPHPLTAAMTVGSPEVCAMATHLYWPHPAGGFLVRAMHTHPLAVWPSVKNRLPGATVDSGFVSAVCPESATWDFVDDSNNVLGVELSPSDEGVMKTWVFPPRRAVELGLWGLTDGDFSQTDLPPQAVVMAAFLRQHPDPFARVALERALCVHLIQGDSGWGRLTATSLGVARQVVAWASERAPLPRVPKVA
ncbi:MAG: hypothetical protein GC164_13815 [Phycisphaera sp.]|nr:hypothetical protein [Phycisphaera sp.]